MIIRKKWNCLKLGQGGSTETLSSSSESWMERLLVLADVVTCGSPSVLLNLLRSATQQVVFFLSSSILIFYSSSRIFLSTGDTSIFFSIKRFSWEGKESYVSMSYAQDEQAVKLINNYGSSCQFEHGSSTRGVIIDIGFGSASYRTVFFYAWEGKINRKMAQSLVEMWVRPETNEELGERSIRELTSRRFFVRDGPAIDLVAARFSASRQVPFRVVRQQLFERSTTKIKITMGINF